MPTGRCQVNLDPTTIRLSSGLLLSDFMVNDSVVRCGYSNRMRQDQDLELEEGRRLAQDIQQMIDLFGPCAISYGFISNELSHKIVRYMDPNEPSYHKWNKGAAADLIFPDMLEKGNNSASPIALAALIEEEQLQYSRLITYAESPWFCYATQLNEGNFPRRALYENRYTGRREPTHIKYPQNREKRMDALAEAQTLTVPWEGQGYPSYHGGGREQFQHQMVGTYVPRLKLLYCKYSTSKGIKNLPPLTNDTKMDRYLANEKAAAGLIDDLSRYFMNHISVTSAYRKDSEKQNWQNFYTLELACPEDVDTDLFHDFIAEHKSVDKIKEVERNGIYSIQVKGL